jgi:hypothetical protein
MYVLAAGVDSPNGRQWTRVFRNQSYAHGRSHPSVFAAQQVPGSSPAKPPGTLQPGTSIRGRVHSL